MLSTVWIFVRIGAICYRMVDKRKWDFFINRPPKHENPTGPTGKWPVRPCSQASGRSYSVLYKMHAKLCPKDLNEMLLLPLERRRVTRASTSTPDHAVSIPAAKTHQLDRSFIHTASRIWNSLPDHVVGTISYMGLQFYAVCIMFLLENGNS